MEQTCSRVADKPEFISEMIKAPASLPVCRSGRLYSEARDASPSGTLP